MKLQNIYTLKRPLLTSPHKRFDFHGINKESYRGLYFKPDGYRRYANWSNYPVGYRNSNHKDYHLYDEQIVKLEER